jgi:hypothetical protein
MPSLFLAQAKALDITVEEPELCAHGIIPLDGLRPA